MVCGCARLVEPRRGVLKLQSIPQADLTRVAVDEIAS
jgi:hypothetical protein